MQPPVPPSRVMNWRRLTSDIRLPPSAVFATIKKNQLFNDFVGGGREGHRHVDAQGPGGLEVEDKLKLGCLYHRQLARRLAPENARDIDAPWR